MLPISVTRIAIVLTKMITARIVHSSKVMVWWLLLLPLSVATLCRPGHQFWSETLEKCINCSTCPEVGHVVLRPCQVHQDTQCGPISALDIDWSFLGRPRSAKRTSSLHRQHLSETYIGSKHPHREDESTQDIDSFSKHNNKNLHPKFISSEEKEERSRKNSHRRKFSSETSFSENIDETPKNHLKHHHCHKEHTSSETHSSNPRKPKPHNRHKNTDHHYHNQKFKWTSSDVSQSFDSPSSSNSSELHVKDGHHWSFSETDTSFEHHTSSFTRSNGTKKHSHHHKHHPHPHKNETNASKSQKHHGKKQKHPNVQKEVGKMLVQRPESASQLKESETVFSSSFDSDVKKDVQGLDAQIFLPKHSHKIGSLPSVSSAPFSATEELIWDWQAVALALAVFACLLFFVVACVYSVHHARQWRRLKDHFEDFEADVGEMSTRLNLLLPVAHSEERGHTDTAQTDCCNNSSQCVYLEKLLARKQQTEEGGEHGNVYIDRDGVAGQRA